MKIRRMRIQNLYSYKDVDFNLYDYNVIAGPNASGKTNLLRVLNFIQGDEQSSGNIDYRRLEKKHKLDPDKKSSVILELELSDYEAIMLMSLIFKQDIAVTNAPESFKKVGIGLYWEDTIDDDTIPIIIFRLGNGFSVIHYHGSDWMCLLNQLPITDLDKKFEMLVNVGQGGNNDYRTKYSQQHNFGPESLFVQDKFRQQLLKGDSVNEFLTVDNIGIKMTSQIEDMRYNSPVQIYQKKVYDFIQITNRTSSQINLWFLLTKIIARQLITIKELRPYYNELAKMLFELRTVEGYAPRESLLSSNFSKIFSDVSYDVRQPLEVRQGIPEDKEPKITIIENGKRYPIEESAAGYFEVLYLLLSSIHAKDSVLILDEPALHLHPTKIRQLGQALLDMVENSGNQILVITHSPYFVNYAIVATSNKSGGLLYVKKQGVTSEAIYRPGGLQLELKPHLFRPEIFFSKCNILVEGAADLATFAGISEGFDNVLDVYDITLIDTWGKGGIEKYIPLLDVYKIPYVAMADSDYAGPKQNVIILEGKLEDELRKLGWDPAKKYKKIDPIIAFEFISELIKTKEGKEKIKNSDFYFILRTALSKIDAKILSVFDTI